GEDPAVKTGTQPMDAWLEPRETAPELRASSKRAWPLVRAGLTRAGPSRRWSRVRGPIGTIRANLLDIGWEARTATMWARPEHGGRWEWQASLQDGADHTEWHVVEVDSEAFGSVSDHQALLRGELKAGADVHLTRRELQRRARRGEWASWSRKMA
ncbi:unnamed protein product, partial [Prorocentrum cordatum]